MPSIPGPSPSRLQVGSLQDIRGGHDSPDMGTRTRRLPGSWRSPLHPGSAGLCARPHSGMGGCRAAHVQPQQSKGTVRGKGH